MAILGSLQLHSNYWREYKQLQFVQAVDEYFRDADRGFRQRVHHWQRQRRIDGSPRLPLRIFWTDDLHGDGLKRF